MLAYITKASDWTYKEFKEINTIEDVLKIYESVIIAQNPYKGVSIGDWDGFSEDDKKNLSKAEIEITIYDDWVE